MHIHPIPRAVLRPLRMYGTDAGSTTLVKIMPELAPRVFDASIHPGSILWTPNIVLVSMGNSIPMNTTRAGP